ncbi:MAG TPA: 1-deoxy-D-xylulose-5-phosphate synthase [Nitrospiria bacterium]|jgi:1-deoxy-D-xylulose-5-phosphate synthase
MGFLEKVKSPDDLKKMSREDLPPLAQEIRDKIIEVVSKTGGHLSTNLGVVELTIALHYLFDTPKDQIVWDTGNQTYAHKLLTGRVDNFHTLRQFEGISGFAKREESIYDTFNAGHAATSLSAAAGFIEARDQKGENHKVVAVIGDGAMTAGMAYEGLNHAGSLKKDLIVILNDNEMSISKNVGAISSYLTKILTGKLYTRVKEEAETLLKSIPRIGEPLLKMARRAEESAKGLIVPGLFFEELGFLYVGPIDGHRFDHLIPTLENVKKLKGPVLIHVITKKGKGYEPAEKDPIFLHAAPPFDIQTGKSKKKSGLPSYTKIFSKAIVDLAKKDKRVVAITAAMAGGTGLDYFEEQIPERFYDVGIAEQHAVTFAAGLAAQGLRPVVAVYSTFLQRAYDQIVHDVCIQNLPVTLCLDRGGMVAEDGTTHHGMLDYSYLRTIPNMVVMAPKDENEMRRMLKTAIERNGPTSLRYPRGSSLGVHLDEEIETLPIGKGELLQDGEDVVLIGIGYTVAPCMEVAQRLEKRGISAAVINARFVKPLDGELLREVLGRVKNVVTVEEHGLMGGFGSAVTEFIVDEGLFDVRVKRIGIPDEFVDQGPQALLRTLYGMDPEKIEENVSRFLKDQKDQVIPGAGGKSRKGQSSGLFSMFKF